MTLDEIRKEKQKAESDIRAFIKSRLGELVTTVGLRPVALTLTTIELHDLDGPTGIMVGDVNIDLGSI